jgi:hypothetical protein
MFTTGSKFFIGGTVLALISAVVYGNARGGEAGLTGTIGLVSAAVAIAVLGGVNYYTRDGNVSGVQQGGGADSPAAQAPPGPTFWPVILAAGAVLVAIGADTYPAFFKLGVVVLIAAFAEWLLHAWSERASADPAYNAGLRRRMAYPVELPVLGAVGAALLAYAFSRIMLSVSKDAGPLVFGLIGAAVVVAGFLVVAKPQANAVVGAVAAFCAVGLVGVGAAAALDGERPIATYPVISDEEYRVICDSPGEVEDDEELKEIDEKASQNVSMRSNLAATVVLENGELNAYPIGVNTATKELSLRRSNPTNIRFRNLDPEHHRFTVRMGEFTEGEGEDATIVKRVTCTSLIDEDGEGFLTLMFPKSSPQTAEPYRIEVPGVENAQISVIVP